MAFHSWRNGTDGELMAATNERRSVDFETKSRRHPTQHQLEALVLAVKA